MTRIRFSFIAGIFLLMVAGSILYGQTDSLPAFNTLRTPTSPAFTLLGVAPTDVERPNTPTALAIALLNATNVSTLPQNFSLEFSPYWLIGGTMLTWREDTVRSILESIERTGTFSIATAQVGNDTGKVTGLSIGLRFSLFSGSTPDSIVRRLQDIEAQLAGNGKLYNKYLTKALNDLQQQRTRDIALAGNNRPAIDTLNKLYIQRIEAAKDSVWNNAAFIAERDTLQKKVLAIAPYREGFFLELAFARSWLFPGGAWGSGGTPDRLGAWITPSYVWKNFSLVGVARYIDMSADSGWTNLDIGGRLIYTASSFAISAEYVNRSFMVEKGQPDIDSQKRLVGEMEYQVSPGLWAIASFGRDFNTKVSGSLIAQLGLSLNLGTNRYKQ